MNSKSYDCCVNPKCGNRFSQNRDVSYFKFPTEPNRYARILKLNQLIINKNLVITFEYNIIIIIDVKSGSNIVD